MLRGALGHAGAGHGQVVAIVGEAGVGKSRLVWELTRSHHTRDSLVQGMLDGLAAELPILPPGTWDRPSIVTLIVCRREGRRTGGDVSFWPRNGRADGRQICPLLTTGPIPPWRHL